MAVDQLPGRVREFANYLNGLLARLDQGGGWCAVFWQRDPDGMRACLEGREVPPWDVVEAVLQDLAAVAGPVAANQEKEQARGMHAAALAAYDARPGGRDDLGDRLDVMLREQRYAAERQAELGRQLAFAATRQEAETCRLDLAWARDDHDRATARCAELRSRMAELDRRETGARAAAVRRGRAGGRGRVPHRKRQTQDSRGGRAVRRLGHGCAAGRVRPTAAGAQQSGDSDGYDADGFSGAPGAAPSRADFDAVGPTCTRTGTRRPGMDRLRAAGPRLPKSPPGNLPSPSPPPPSSASAVGAVPASPGWPRRRPRPSWYRPPPCRPCPLRPLPAAAPRAAPGSPGLPMRCSGRRNRKREPLDEAGAARGRRGRRGGSSGCVPRAAAARRTRCSSRPPTGPPAGFPLLAERAAARRARRRLGDPAVGGRLAARRPAGRGGRRAGRRRARVRRGADPAPGRGPARRRDRTGRAGAGRAGPSPGGPGPARRVRPRPHPRGGGPQRRAGPADAVPLLLEAAQGVSDECHWDLVHALRVAGFTA